MTALRTLRSLFDQASEVDPDLKTDHRLATRLRCREIKSACYSREILFENMARGKVSLFRDFPPPLHRKFQSQPDRVSGITHIIRDCDVEGKIRTRVGTADNWRYYTPQELMEKWLRNKAKINVTDFHFRDTSIESVVDSRVLSQFNLFPQLPSEVAWMEMMTLVVSNQWGFSDSHSDDCDGSNHCFTGRKLWLVWDTAEGLVAGLQDSDQQRVDGKCAFDMQTFLSLQSACWFVVEAGDTLFMPGSFTHKVITLKQYLGVGSFYLALPNLLRTLSRWRSQTPNWARHEPLGFHDTVFNETERLVRNKVRQLSRTSAAHQRRWGLDYMPLAWRIWVSGKADRERNRFQHLEELHTHETGKFAVR